VTRLIGGLTGSDIAGLTGSDTAILTGSRVVSDSIESFLNLQNNISIIITNTTIACIYNNK
jgi:hypothetical protein